MLLRMTGRFPDLSFGPSTFLVLRSSFGGCYVISRLGRASSSRVRMLTTRAICYDYGEHALHLFVDCSYAMECWVVSNLQLPIPLSILLKSGSSLFSKFVTFRLLKSVYHPLGYLEV
ncbi:hypothetical protein M5689_024377 [Euphorbia peplus]|nr:hypothetical protein M5689_024377 [Euphorbia peplus]